MPAKRESACLLLDDGAVRIPAGLYDLATFRRWACSDDFPERGRIDYLGGAVEVDMSPEDVGTHGSPKGAIYLAIASEVRARDLGEVWVDRTRLSNVAADLSCEPDVVFFSWKTLETGRARLVPKAGGEEGRYVELEGTADIVVEVVSDSSVGKDTERLKARYHAARVTEYWVADARRTAVRFDLFTWREGGYALAVPDPRGLVLSTVLGRKVKLLRTPARAGLWRYTLELRPPGRRHRRSAST